MGRSTVTVSGGSLDTRGEGANKIRFPRATMNAKQMLYVFGGIVVLWFGYGFLSGSTEFAEEECALENRQPLPYCAEQQRIGNNITVANNCTYPITVHWEVTGGSDLIHELEPGVDKKVSSYPLKVSAISCCEQTNSCF